MGRLISQLMPSTGFYLPHILCFILQKKKKNPLFQSRIYSAFKHIITPPLYPLVVLRYRLEVLEEVLDVFKEIDEHPMPCFNIRVLG